MISLQKLGKMLCFIKKAIFILEIFKFLKSLPFRVQLNFEKWCEEKFCHWFIPQRLGFGTDFPWLLKINFLFKTSFLEKFKLFFFIIFNANLTTVTTKSPKHLLNAMEKKTCRNGVKTYHIEMLNCIISYSNQIFKQNPFFYNTRLC